MLNCKMDASPEVLEYMEGHSQIHGSGLGFRFFEYRGERFCVNCGFNVWLLGRIVRFIDEKG